MRAAVAALGVIAPGMAGWEGARAVLACERPFESQPVPVLAPASLPAAERRRSSPTVRLAIAAAEQALATSPVPAPDMALVFSSAEAAGVITHQLCEVLAGTREVSPTQFHNSVHNAPSGYYSIAMGARRGAASLCRGHWSFAAGLLAAVAQVAADEVPVLYVCYDSPLPQPLAAQLPVVEPTAIAMVLSPRASQGACGSISLDILAGAADPWLAWMPREWHANAAARGFAALGALAGPIGGSARLPLSDTLVLRVTRC
jgi:hypothetical protein